MSAVVTLIRVYKESMVTMSPCSLILLSRGWGVGREKSYGQGTGLFDGVSSSPRSPRGSFRSASLHHCCCCCAQEGVVHASLLSFCTSFSQLSRYGLATPSSHDGCCVCFFVLCNRHWFNRVPGPNRDGGYLSTLRFCSDASYADLPL